MDSLFLYPLIDSQANFTSNQQPVFSNLIHKVRILCLCDSVKRSAFNFIEGADIIYSIDWSVPVQWK